MQHDMVLRHRRQRHRKAPFRAVDLIALELLYLGTFPNMAWRGMKIGAWPIKLALIASVLLLINLTSVFGPTIPPRPLVAPDAWQNDGGFFSDPLTITHLDAPDFVRNSGDLVTWRSWSPKTGGTIGRLASASFDMPQFIAIPYSGFPSERSENKLVLICDTTGREMKIASLRTNTQWATRYLKTADFCSGRGHIVATSGDERFYVAVATPFQISSTEYYAATQFAPRALIVLLTTALFALLGMNFGVVAFKLHRNLHPLAAAFTGIGIVGMATLAAFTYAPAYGASMCFAIGGAAFAGFVLLCLFMRRSLLEFLAAHGPSGLLWIGIALCYAAFVSLADSGGGTWAINGLFSPLRWSSDNQLPMLLSEGLLDGSDMVIPPAGQWQATDRGPLLAALLTLPSVCFRPLISKMGLPLGDAYTMMAITILSSWATLIPWFCRSMAIQRVAVVFVIAAASPFMIFNTVYTWPKILGGSYVLIAFLLLIELSRDMKGRRPSLPMVAVSATLALLAHASNVFVLLPLALVFVPTIWRSGLPMIAISIAAAAVTYLPWAYWQIEVQPHGNALMLYALAGRLPLDRRSQPVIATIADAYRELGVQGLIDQKIASLKLLIDVNGRPERFPETNMLAEGRGMLGSARVLDFFILTRTLGVAVIGLAALVIRLLSRPFRRETSARYLFFTALIGGAGTGFAILVSMPEPIVHQQAYGAVILLLLAGAGSLANMRPFIAKAAMAAALIYAGVVWVGAPLWAADHLLPNAILGVGLGMALIFQAIMQLRAAEGSIEAGAQTMAGNPNG